MTQHSVHVVLQCHVTNKNHYISSTRVPMATKLDRMVTYFERLLTIKSFYALITWSCKVTKKKILYISITRVPMANKLGRIMISFDGLLPIITNDLLIMQPCEIRGYLTWGGSASKRLSRHQLLVWIQLNNFPNSNLMTSIILACRAENDYTVEILAIRFTQVPVSIFY